MMRKLKRNLSLLFIIIFILVTGLYLIIPSIEIYILCLAAILILSLLSACRFLSDFAKRNRDELHNKTPVYEEKKETDAALPDQKQIKDIEEKLNELDTNFLSLKNTLSPLLNQSEEIINKLQVFFKESEDKENGGLDSPSVYLDQMKKDLTIISENSNKVFNISDNISQSAEKAMELSRTVKEGITSVTQSLTESLKYSKDLFIQSEKIGEIIEIISEISSKTNVLSINASIVSARAGQQGKTFEVVAKEIRNLASETDRSLKEIESVVKEIQSVIQLVAEKIESSEERTRKEMEVLLTVAGSLQGVVLGVEVVRTVSQVVKEKSDSQNSIIVLLSDIIDKQKSHIDKLDNIDESLNIDVTSIARIKEILNKLNLALEKIKLITK